MEKQIDAQRLMDAYELFNTAGDGAPQDTIDLIKQFHIYPGVSKMATKNAITLGRAAVEKKSVILVGEELRKASPMGKDDQEKPAEVEVKDIGSSKDPKEKGVNEGFVGVEKITDIEIVKDTIKKSSYKIDVDAIKKHLENFLKSVTIENEAYTTGEVVIKFFKEKLTDVGMLVASGTKILDALMFVAMHDNEEAKGIFSFMEVKELSALSIAENMSQAKKAIQAAGVLVYINGGLPPNKGTDTRPVPKFVKEFIYQNEIGGLIAIGEQLSSGNTRKFPAKVFLNVDLNSFPLPVATRCKLAIAGNKAVRYAVFAGSCQKASMISAQGITTVEAMENVMKVNARRKLAIEIADFLRTLSGAVEAQKRMHPLSPNKPTIKDLTLKLTRAIIESLSTTGLAQLYEKMEASNNNAFMKDTNFAGTEADGKRTWHIVVNSDAEFAELSVGSLKAMYGIV
uniref:50 kDa nucleocapsid protein n=1 Tax=Blueberry mosaic associated virus TaxID=1520332 RepID=A0A0S3QNW9_9VIRU|nr:50 kDa nucleocapsid protein [Blueberry mosaic associated virus]